MRNTLNCENVDSLANGLQLLHKLIQGWNWEFLKKLVTKIRCGLSFR